MLPFALLISPLPSTELRRTPHAWFITRTMACPWQSDFFECAEQTETTVWWPAQRPINVFVDAQAQTQKAWIDSIPNHQALVEKFWKLGFIQKLPSGAAEPLVEAERDPSVPHP